MKRRITAIASALLALMLGQTASAENAADVITHMKTAYKQVTSFRMEMEGPFGFAGHMTVVLPDRMLWVRRVGGETTEISAHGASAYMRTDGGAWSPYHDKACCSPVLGFPFMDVPSATALPDKTEDGVVVGVISGAVSGSTMTCTYDKTTFLTKRCSAPLPDFREPLITNYGKWNDPSNLSEIISVSPDAAPSAHPSASPTATP